MNELRKAVAEAVRRAGHEFIDYREEDTWESIPVRLSVNTDSSELAMNISEKLELKQVLTQLLSDELFELTKGMKRRKICLTTDNMLRMKVEEESDIRV